MKRWVALLTALVIGFIAWKVQRRMLASRPKADELVVYAYSSFVGSWGAGPKIVKEFETLYGVKIRLIDAGDARLLLQKVELEGSNLGADVLVGFDQFTAGQAHDKIKFHSVDLGEVSWDSRFPAKLKGDVDFVPFDWSPITFIYRKGEVEPPHSLDDLRDARFAKSISLMDPRTSTPGYQFLEWIALAKGEAGIPEFYKQLKPSVFAYSPSWSLAYGMFKKKEAKLALSYLTSPVYHWIEEKDRSFQAAVFEGGHPYQVEFAGIPSSCKACSEAEEFVKFLLSHPAQNYLMTSNYMFPVVSGVVDRTEFERLPSVKTIELPSRDSNGIENLLQTWKTAQ